jgi:light-harvesting complex 1 alpha chain
VNVSRSTVRINAIIWSILGLVVALLIHFIVLSSDRYNWVRQRDDRQSYLAPVELVLEAPLA